MSQLQTEFQDFLNNLEPLEVQEYEQEITINHDYFEGM